jgi:hypothetical protein
MNAERRQLARLLIESAERGEARVKFTGPLAHNEAKNTRWMIYKLRTTPISCSITCHSSTEATLHVRKEGLLANAKVG